MLTPVTEETPGAGPGARALVQACREGDLTALETNIPSPGRSTFHRNRFREQSSGRSIYLIAWVAERPVGHVLVRWSGTNQPAVRRVLGQTPMLNALGVSAPYRRRGIATELILHAERLARDRGHRAVGLGVDVDNAGARRLYDRLGYRDWGHGTVPSQWTWTSDNGQAIREDELLLMLVKPLG